MLNKDELLELLTEWKGYFDPDAWHEKDEQAYYQIKKIIEQHFAIGDGTKHRNNIEHCPEKNN